jgi:hypothetical protein
MIRKLTINGTVMMVAFAIGIFVSFMVSEHLERDRAEATSSVATRIDEWHRLFEAAGMSGDGEIIKQVSDRLYCANNAGESQGVLVTLDQHMFCRTSDGDIQDLTDSGSFWRKIKESHLRWSLQNSDFVASVVNPEAAREYVRKHQAP